MSLSIPISLQSYAIWMAVWIAIWGTVGFVWLQVHWIRRTVRAYHEHSPAERILEHARRVRDKQVKPALEDIQRKLHRRWAEWRKSR